MAPAHRSARRHGLQPHPLSTSLSNALILLVAVLSAAFLLACSQSPDEKLDEIRALQSAGHFDESIPLLIELIESSNQSGEVLFRYGRGLVMIGEANRANWALDAARDDPEWLVDASMSMARFAHRSHNWNFALEILERLRNERTDSGDELPALILEARTLVADRSHYQEALDLAETILDDFPNEEQAVRVKGAALIGLKRTDEAFEWIHAAGLPADTEGEGIGEVDGAGNTDDDTDDVETTNNGDEREKLDLDLEPSARKPYWCTVQVTFKREANELDEASRILERCLATHPADEGLLQQAFKVYSQTGEHARILEILRTASESDPTNQSFPRLIIQYMIEAGSLADAEAAIREGLDAARSENPESVATATKWLELAGFLISNERLDEGLEAFDRVMALIGDRVNPQVLFQYAEALILAERFDDALAISERTSIEVHAPMIRGRVAFERSDYELAARELSAAALQWPDNAPIRYYLARAREGLGDFDQAIEEYRQAMRSDTSLSAPRERLARLHLSEGRVRHAVTILQFRSPKQKSAAQSAAMQVLMVEALARLGNTPDLSISPTPEMSADEVRLRSVRALSRGLRLRNDARVAESDLARLEPGSAEMEAAILRERVELLVSGESVDEAVALARSARPELKTTADIRLALGRALVAARMDLDEADELLRSVLDTRPEEAEAWASLGDLATLRNDPAAAADAHDRALELEPALWQALSPRVDALIEAGKRNEALERLEAFVRRHGTYDGRGALEWAIRLEADAHIESVRTRRLELARQAVRFAGGEEALWLLASLDPNISFADPSPTPLGPDDREADLE
ncbi:MAG: tetratricopeptide repeat protein [bacterium]|nr:tetratricopeptide repeat protein [bacterium]